MTSLLGSAIQGASRGVQIGDNIRQRRRAASAFDAADAWEKNAQGWKKEAHKWHGEYKRILEDFERFIEEDYNPVAKNLLDWQEYANNMKGYMKTGYSMWVGAEYDRDNAYLAIQQMSELIRRLDPENKEFDNPNKVGVDIQNKAITTLKSAIERYLEEVKVGTPFSAQFTEETLGDEIEKRHSRAKEHQDCVDSGDTKMKMF